ncbi:AAA family ATPase [Desulfovibrio inopinatus]|uniref:AAA family ATPase n=1 Tax=Desulfovibrio inopinatus TaxID=102109 RepID=UPI00041B9455|nr:ATP-binding protein [Desulfovibrio inopinatus]
MIKKLILKNFLAHGDTEIEFTPGLNILSGPNNTGKSAVVEALRCLAENPVPQHFIRHGAKEARVCAVLEDDVTITWIRRKTYALYEVQYPNREAPEVFAKFGRRPPDDIRSLLRLDQVDIEGGKTLDVHIGNQREPVFLFRESGPVQASFFASSSESAHLLAMQKRLAEKERSSKKDLKRLNREMADTARFLDQLAPLPAIELTVETANRLLREHHVVADAVSRLHDILHTQNALNTTIHTATAKHRAMAALIAPPGLWPSGNLARLLRTYRDLTNAHDIAQRKKRSIDPMLPAPTLFPSTSLRNFIDRFLQKQNDADSTASRLRVLGTAQPAPVLFDTTGLNAIRQRLDTLKAGLKVATHRTQATTGLVAPPDLTAIDRLEDVITALRNKTNASHLLRKNAVALAKLTPVPELRDVSDLAGLIPRLTKSRQDVERARQRCIAEQSKLEHCRVQIEKRLTEIGHCPLCGADLDEAHATRFLHESRANDEDVRSTK